MRKYLFYGGSIFFARGLEYIVLLAAPLLLTKADYGELEFYKKAIELSTAILSFGLPTLILTYPKSENSKKYFTVLSFLFIAFLAVIFSPLFFQTNYLFLLLPIFFHAIFFNNGIVPPFVLTTKGSNYASIYKSTISLVFYVVVVLFLLYSPKPYLCFVYVNYVLLPILLIFALFYFKLKNLNLRQLKLYWRLFKKLIFSSFTIVLSNIANMMFLYTDIIIIKLLSDKSSLEIANYSFSLNIANALVFIPLTLVQVDIERLKTKYEHTTILNKKIVKLVFIFTILLLLIFLILTNYLYTDYKETFSLFIIILFAKFFQSLSVLYGAQVLIRKEFFKNLIINSTALVLNILLSYLFYQVIGLLGIACASLISLTYRYVLLIRLNRKFVAN